MSSTVLVGTQWGDEGKGKICDLIAGDFDCVVRYQGGNNAGHTIVVGDKKYGLHQVPSGIMYPQCISVIGNGCVVNPAVLLEEIDMFEHDGISTANLKVSGNAHVIMPYHMDLDGAYEELLGSHNIGTTKRGIGPCYEDKVARRGVRVGDLAYPEILKEKLRSLMDYRNFLLRNPFVTSSNTVAGGCCTGSGAGPLHMDYVLGIGKAYTTRVGGGPFPTELNDETGEHIRKAGQEFGAVTGRPRRTGWFDAVAMRRAVQINSLSGLALMKLDVLDGMQELKICTAYKLKDGTVTELPPLAAYEYADVEPVYETMPGWSESTFGVTDFAKLPVNAQNYIRRLEELSGVKVAILSTGPERSQTIFFENPFA